MSDVQKFIDNIEGSVDMLESRRRELVIELRTVEKQIRILTAARDTKRIGPSHKRQRGRLRDLIYDFIRTMGRVEGFAGLREAAEREGYSRRSIYPYVRRLVAQGLVVRHGDDSFTVNESMTDTEEVDDG